MNDRAPRKPRAPRQEHRERVEAALQRIEEELRLINVNLTDHEPTDVNQFRARLANIERELRKVKAK